MQDFSLWALIISSVVYFAIGAVWYTPLFGKIWVKAQGIKDTGNYSKSDIFFPMFFEFLVNIIYVYGIYFVLLHTKYYAAGQGWLVGLLIAVFFGIPIHSGQYIFLKRRTVFLIDSGYTLIGSVIAGILLNAIHF